jgi:hypothetical protein
MSEDDVLFGSVAGLRLRRPHEGQRDVPRVRDQPLDLLCLEAASGAARVGDPARGVHKHDLAASPGDFTSGEDSVGSGSIAQSRHRT